MFGKMRPNQAQERTAGNPEPSATRSKKPALSMLGEGCSFEGRTFLQGEIRIGGHIKGIIVSDHLLVIEENAKIEGDISGVQIELSGTVHGNITASERLTLTEKARIEGDLRTTCLVVDEGARINGHVQIVDNPNELKPKNHGNTATASATVSSVKS